MNAPRSQPPTPACPSNRARQRRGVAMLLVLLALGVGVTLSGTMLTSRETTPQIARNSRELTAAQWAAEGAANIAVAALQSEIDVVGSCSDGWLVNQWTVGGCDTGVRIETLHGGPVTSTDRELLITAVARVGGMTVEIPRRISFAPKVPLEEAASLELPEFAIYALGSLDIRSGARVAPLKTSPDASSLVPVKIGVGFASDSSYAVDANAELTHAMLVVDASADSGLRNRLTSPRFADGLRLNQDLPTIPEQLPPWMQSLPTATRPTLGNTGRTTTTTTAPSGGVYTSLAATNESVVILDAAIDDKYKFSSISLNTGAKLTIKGRVYVHVTGAFQLQGKSSITLADDTSSVVFFTQNGVQVNDSTIGVPASYSTDSARTAEGVAEYSPASRVRFLALYQSATPGSAPEYRLRGNSLISASLHNPYGRVRIEAGSSLIGRATAWELRLEGGATLLYDRRLDHRMGYTVTNGPLFQPSGNLLASVQAALAAITPASGMSAASAAVAQAARAEVETEETWNDVADIPVQETDMAILAIKLYPVNQIYVAPVGSGPSLLGAVVEAVVDPLAETTNKALGGLLGGKSATEAALVDPDTAATPEPTPGPTDVDGVTERVAAKVTTAPVPASALGQETP